MLHQRAKHQRLTLVSTCKRCQLTRACHRLDLRTQPGLQVRLLWIITATRMIDHRLGVQVRKARYRRYQGMDTKEKLRGTVSQTG
jgi:hypothetical protein